MIHMITHDPASGNPISPYIGRELTELQMLHEPEDWREDFLLLSFADGGQVRIWDDGRSCYEDRYMHTDDELSQFVGATLVGAEVRDGPMLEGEYGDAHEMQFLLITTSKGVVTIETHNRHNGYYSGFWLALEPII